MREAAAIVRSVRRQLNAKATPPPRARSPAPHVDPDLACEVVFVRVDALDAPCTRGRRRVGFPDVDQDQDLTVFKMSRPPRNHMRRADIECRPVISAPIQLPERAKLL